MSNYVKATDFQAKDSLLTGNPSKIIMGSELNDEFNAIQTAVATKADTSSPALLGNPTAPTQAVGNDSTRLATTAFVQAQLASDATAVGITGGTIDGVVITGGTISGLATDLAVADGGTGSSTLSANAVLLGNGTSALQTVNPSTSGNVLTSNGTTWVSSTPAPALGVNQTWQDVTSSRSAGTTYTNNTGKPIMISISISGPASTSINSLTVGGVLVGYVSGDDNLNPRQTISSIVPNGTNYVFSTGCPIISWAELR